MFLKSILSGMGALALLSSIATAGPKGLGVDIIHPMAVADYDNVSDEGSMAFNVIHATGGDKDSTSGYFNFGLGKWGDNGVSTSLLYYTSDFNNDLSKWEAEEFQLSVYLNRSLLKKDDGHGNMKGWRPSKVAVNSYFGLGLANTSVDYTALSTDPIVADLNGNSDDKGGMALVLNAGLVGNWSITKRHGIEAYAHLDQHVHLESTFFGSAAPTITAGLAYAYRFNSQAFFPPELLIGVLTSPQTNDVESDAGVGFSISYRLRY
jgi:hypothetical protein